MSQYIYLPMKKGRRTRFDKWAWTFEYKYEPMWDGDRFLQGSTWFPVGINDRLFNQLKGKLN